MPQDALLQRARGDPAQVCGGAPLRAKVIVPRYEPPWAARVARVGAGGGGERATAAGGRRGGALAILEAQIQDQGEAVRAKEGNGGKDEVGKAVVVLLALPRGCRRATSSRAGRRRRRRSRRRYDWAVAVGVWGTPTTTRRHVRHREAGVCLIILP